MTILEGKVEYFKQPVPPMDEFEAEQNQIQEDYYKQLAKIGAGTALELGATALAPAGLGVGAKVGTQMLKPFAGKAIGRAIGQGVVSGGLSGGLSGIGLGLMTDQNPISSGLEGAAAGALGGGALGLGAGKISNTIRTNKINDLLSKRKDWGIAYQKASGNPALAIETLLANKKGFVPNAVNKRGIGNIDFIWGKHNYATDEGAGLEHIIARREKQGIDTNQFLRELPDTIRNGVITFDSRYPTRKYIEDFNKKLSFGTDWNGKNHNWLVTSFKQNQSAKNRLMKDFPQNFGQTSKLWDVIHNKKEKVIDSLYDLIHGNKW